MTPTKAWMSLNFGRIPLLNSELAALERLKKKTTYNLVSTLAPTFSIGSSSFLQVWRTTIISQTSSKFGRIRPRTAELAALERLKNSHKYNGENLVSTLEPSFLIGSFSFLQVSRTTIEAWMSLNFGRIALLTLELAALECLKKKTIYNLVNTLAPSFLIGSSSFLQLKRTSIIS